MRAAAEALQTAGLPVDAVNIPALERDNSPDIWTKLSTMVNAFHVSSTTVPFSLTGHPALSMRFGTSSDGMPIAVQVVANLHADSTVLHLAAPLETLSPVRDQRPAL